MREETQVTVVDALMGAGKTSWAINYIDQHRDDNFLYITPYKNETERIKNAVARDVKIPAVKDASCKLGNILTLLRNEDDVVSTHVLFTMLTEEHKDAIRQGKYTLIIDECLEAVAPFEATRRDDIQFLLDKGSIRFEADGSLRWTDKDYDCSYNLIKNLADNHALFRVNNQILLWKYPPDIFGIFEKVYVLTYNFVGSTMRYYFDLSGIKYQIQSIEKVNGEYKLTDYFEPSRKRLREKIHIYGGNDLNELFNQKKSAFSATWYKSNGNKSKITSLKNGIYNYFRNKNHAKSGDIMWTVFKSKYYALRGKGYSNSFVSLGCRATNNYSDRHYLGYLANVYPHAGVSQFFIQQGHPIDQDQYALCEMIQWIFRSAIRNGEDIHIYIPSRRMRGLLEEWLND